MAINHKTTVGRKFLSSAYLLLLISSGNNIAWSQRPADTDVREPLGTVISKDFNPVWVNELFAVDGMTVRSGSNVRAGKSHAFVDIRDVGEVDLCPESTVNLVFNHGKIEAKLIAGQVSLMTVTKVEGSLITTDGKILKSDPRQSTSRIEIGCSRSDSRPSGAGPDSAFLGLKFVGAAAFAAALSATVNSILVLPGNARQNVGQVRP
jgi:hypothetical protein